MFRWVSMGRVRRREAALAAWNTKILGSLLARRAYEAGLAGYGMAAPGEPRPAGLTGRLCRQADVEAPWLHHWCARQHIAPLYHRKVWEDCFVPQALWEAGMLAPGRRGLGFAVGEELLPCIFAADGVEVLATDLPAGDPRAREWIRTAQHMSAREHLFHPHLIGREDFEARVAFRPVDMAHIPAELMRGEFDFVWSVCSFEHLGTVEAGLDFVLRAMRCLKPGGVAVHTTEFNLLDDGPGVEKGKTVLFRRRHLETLMRRLEAAGHAPLPMDYEPGSGLLDRFVDLPPFAGQGIWPLPIDPGDTPHLKLSVRGCISTSAGIIIRAAQ